jgi:hypothetical protein
MTDRLVDTVSELITMTDPQINQEVDYPSAVRLIHRVQLLLDRSDERQARLNGRLNALGIALAGLIKHPDGAVLLSRATASDVLRAHGEVIDATQAVLAVHAN